MIRTRFDSRPQVHSSFRRLAWRAGPVVLATALMSAASVAAPGDRPDHGPGGPGGAAARAEHRQEFVHGRLEQAANRLEIKASQQGAWQAFAQSVQAFATPPAAARPGRDADAASIARYRADRATENARKLAVLADTTAKLQSVLGDDQRKVFDEMAHRFAQHEHHRHWEGRDHEREHRGS